MVMLLRGLTLVALVLVVSTVGQAKTLRDFLEGEESVETSDGALLVELAKYYRMHANVRLGQEHRLANGVAWRLLTDVRTGAVAPRITWMADRRSMLRANGLFEAIHGADIVYYDRTDLIRRQTELYQWEDGSPPFGVIKPPYTVQEKVAVSYATPRLVSYVDVTREVRAISMGVNVFGRVLDLERGEVWSIVSCPGSAYDFRNFRFGELLEVCGDDAYKSFIVLWASKVRQAIEKARSSGDDLSEYCGESMEPLIRESRVMSFYLTPVGVAVFNGEWFPRIAKHCAFKKITVNPIVLSYRELEPFMRPGLWRDDVLQQGRGISR
jgi:hypothetical protein